MEKVNKLLTVVVPVYKVEPYINKCLDSLLVPAEQLEQLEVIIVNDGTPDRSAEMAREYEKRYPQTFRVIDKENGGHGSAWNRGLHEATGKYLRFLDSDDWFDTAVLTSLMIRLSEIDADMVISDRVVFHAETGEEELHSLVTSSWNQTVLVSDFNWYEQGNIWFQSITYKTSILKGNVSFLEKTFYDDTILYIAPIILSKTIHVFPGSIYYYLLGREGQTMDPSVKERHQKALWKARHQAVSFYLEHSARKYGECIVKYFEASISSMMIQSFVSLIKMPYTDSSNLISQWKDLYKRLRRSNLKIEWPFSVRMLKWTPFPIYHFIMNRRWSLLEVV